MRDEDYRTFSTMLDQVCGLLGRGSYKPDSQATALWFRALTSYDIDVVRAAFDAHVKDPARGRFVPTPADIIGQIHTRHSRPSADEAWAIAVKGADESASVTWNDEIAEAWGICLPVWRVGDEVGARMAFKDAYERITSEHKGQPVRWWASLGHDAAAREPELRNAVSAGLLTHDAALMLQAPDSGTLTRLAYNPQTPADVRDKLLALRERLIAKPGADDYVPDPDIARTAELKAASRELYEADCRARGFVPDGGVA